MWYLLWACWFVVLCRALLALYRALGYHHWGFGFGLAGSALPSLGMLWLAGLLELLVCVCAAPVCCELPRLSLQAPNAS